MFVEVRRGWPLGERVPKESRIPAMRLRLRSTYLDVCPIRGSASGFEIRNTSCGYEAVIIPLDEVD